MSATELKDCPHGHGQMTAPVNGDLLEPENPYCSECGHIQCNSCENGCHYEGE